MASAEEKAAILAEYAAGLADEDDDDDEFEEEGDFVDEEDEDDEDDENGFDDGDDDEDEEFRAKEDDSIVLRGSLHLNDEGRVVYAGTWCMKRESEAESKAHLKQKTPAETSSKDTNQTPNVKTATVADNDDRESPQKTKKKTKFKLKSKLTFRDPNTKNTHKDDHHASAPSALPIFDLADPVGSGSPQKTTTTNGSKTLLFDGFFHAGEDEGHRKVKERDVEITFTQIESHTSKPSPDMSSPTSDELDHATKSTASSILLEKKRPTHFAVQGKGRNEFGPFQLKGTYNICDSASLNGNHAVASSSMSTDDSHCALDDDGGKTKYGNTLVCGKYYNSAPPAKTLRRNRRRQGNKDDDDDDDDVIPEGHHDEETDFNELVALNEEAGMSVEELRKRYYGEDNEEAKKTVSHEHGSLKRSRRTSGAVEDEQEDDDRRNFKPSSSKRRKTRPQDEESDDDAYGF